MVDIHSHILPNLDDGAENVEESIMLLKIMQAQGITDVFVTPHFYPTLDNYEDFNSALLKSLKLIKKHTTNLGLPNIYLGCEMFYFVGIGDCDTLTDFTFENSRFLLLELDPTLINEHLFDDIKKLINIQKITPVLAHLERYADCKGYRKLLRFIKKEKILTQINSSSLLYRESYQAVKKLIKKDLVTFMATDTHSVDKRPPHFKTALYIIEKDFGKDVKEKLIENSNSLLKKIQTETTDNA